MIYLFLYLVGKYECSDDQLGKQMKELWEKLAWYKYEYDAIGKCLCELEWDSY